MNQGGHNRFSECGWFVCFSADSGTQVILDNPVILSKNLYTYDRLGRQLSAIAAGVSTNLYAYSTNTLELVSETQNGVVINRSHDAFGRESGLALETDYDVSYTFDTFGRFSQVSNFQFQVSFCASFIVLQRYSIFAILAKLILSSRQLY